MRDYEEILKSMRICLNVDIDSNCLSECFGCAYIDHDHHIMDVVRDAAGAIEELLAAVPQWISVEERLPEFGERVLVSNGGFVCESFLSQSGKWQRGGVDMFFMTPTHWMPLPEAPKEGDE